MGQVEVPAGSVAELLERNATDPDRRDRPAIRFGDQTWTHGQYVSHARRWANLFLARRRPDAPFHVAVLLDNIPEYLFALGGAALAGATLVGLNHTRAGPQLLDDLTRTHCGMLVYEQKHQALVDPILDEVAFDARNVLRVEDSLGAALEAVDDTDPSIVAPLESTWLLIFTSGTSAAPKAVITSHRRMFQTGTRMSILMDLTADDVGYVCMPLYHSNSLQVGWMPSIISGASVALARKFSASGWLPDVRRYGATYWNYTGKPLAYLLAQPEREDDADNPLRVAYGNEGAPRLVEAFSERFGVEVIDGFGATEGGLATTRSDDDPPDSVGKASAGLRIVDEAGNFLPPARFDAEGKIIDPASCVGEIVNTAGVGLFEGYYNNDEANARTTRNGWYWSGDLGYLDEDGYLYFAGRDAEWIRVDGENFPAGPIDAVLNRAPGVLVAAAYGVPDPEAGDQVMAALVMADGEDFDPAGFAAWLDVQPDLPAKWRPRYLRVARQLPTSPTNKVLKRTLVHEKYRPDRTGDDELWVRDRGEPSYRRFQEADAKTVHAGLEAAGRARHWDL